MLVAAAVDEQQQLELELAVLRMVGGSAVSAYDRNKPGAAFDLNKAGVKLKLLVEGRDKWINVHFNRDRD